MGLFERMRENTKAILWVTVIAFVGLIFLAWGANFTSKRRTRHEPGVIGKVNGERIYALQYSRKVDEARTTYQLETGKVPDPAVEIMLEAQAWAQLVEDALIRQDAKRRGIRVTDKETADFLLVSPPRRYVLDPTFHTDGKFDPQKFASWVAHMEDTRVLEAEARNALLRFKVQMEVLSGVEVSEEEVRRQWLAENERADFAYALVPYHKIRVEEKPSEEDLTQYLEQHREDFRLPERVEIKYIKIPKEETPQDSIDSYTLISEAYDELRRGEDFYDIVAAYSEAPENRRGGEAADFLSRSQFASEEIADSVFALEPGQRTGILIAKDGFRIIKLEEKKTIDGVEKVKIAEILIPRRLHEDTNELLGDRAADVADSTLALGFDEAARAAGLEPHTTGLFDPEGFIPGLGRMEAARQFARKAKAGEVSRPIQTRDAWYVLYLEKREPSRIPDLDEVRARVEAAWKLDLRKRKAKETAQRLLENVLAGTPLKEAADQESLATYSEVQNATRMGYLRGIGRDTKVTGAVFASEIGVVPRVVMGAQGAFVLEVLARHEVDEEKFAQEKDALRQRLLAQKRTKVLTEWIEELKRNASIEDFRYRMVSV